MDERSVQCHAAQRKPDSVSIQAIDNNTILKGEKLNDLHVNYAQSLLKRQFPNRRGFQSTLFQQRVLNGVTETGLFVNEQLQVIHCREDHWIAASSIGAKADEVNVCGERIRFCLYFC